MEGEVSQAIVVPSLLHHLLSLIASGSCIGGSIGRLLPLPLAMAREGSVVHSLQEGRSAGHAAAAILVVRDPQVRQVVKVYVLLSLEG